ncbi:MAG: hypothetical protein ACOYBJ_01530 [Patescibacteria group bacterium]
MSLNFDSEPVNEALNQAKFRDQGVLVASYATAQPHVAANTKPCSGSASQYKQMVIGRSPAGLPSASEPVQFFPSRSGYVAKKVTVAVLTGNTPFQTPVYALDMSGKVISSQTVEQSGGDCNQVKTVTVEHPGGISQVGVVSGASTQTPMNVTSTPNIKDYQAKFGVAKVDVEWVAEPTGTPKTYPSLPVLTNQAGRSGEAVLATTGTSTLQWQLSTPKAAFREFESVPVSVKNTGLYPVSIQGVDYGVYCTGANDTVRVGGGAFIAEYPVALAPGQTVVIPSFLDSTSLRCSGPNRMVRIGVGSATNPGRIELVVQSSNAAAKTVPNWCLPFMQTYIPACRP